MLKAWCEDRTGRTPGPSDVAEERKRPCRAQWGHDLSMGRTLEKLGPTLYSPECVEGRFLELLRRDVLEAVMNLLRNGLLMRKTGGRRRTDLMETFALLCGFSAEFITCSKKMASPWPSTFYPSFTEGLHLFNTELRARV